MARLKEHFVRDQLIGPEAWSKMVARWGGCDFTIPADTACLRARVLASVIGERAAARLIGYGGATRIYIHADAESVLAARIAELRTLRQRGMTIAELAAIEWPSRYTERHIMRLLAGGDPRERDSGSGG
jgi:hypothetical protein